MAEHTYNLMELQDEALDAPLLNAGSCNNCFPPYCLISNEALDGPTLEAVPTCNGLSGPACTVSDEALDAAPADITPCGGICSVPCRVSDEALDAPEQQAGGPCTHCGSCLACVVSDEALEAAPADVTPCVVTCVVPCAVSDEALDAPEQHANTCTICTVVCGVTSPCVIACKIDGEDRAVL